MVFSNRDIIKITTLLLTKQNHDSIDIFRDKVLLTNEKFKELFGKRFITEHNAAPWKRGIVTIKSGDKKILRMFYGGNTYKLKKDQIGLTQDSLNQLGIIDIKDTPYCISIKPAKPFIGKFIFYWQNPVDAVRIAFKGAFYYCLIGIITSITFSLLIK